MTRNELYGYLHPATREWKEGLMSVTFRDMSNNKVIKHQWIVLDGDIDAEWIESMNTVMGESVGGCAGNGGQDVLWYDWLNSLKLQSLSDVARA